MTTVIVRCSDCEAELRLPSSAVKVFEYGPDAEVWYSFTCDCGVYCSRLADDETIGLLALAGLKPKPAPHAPTIAGIPPQGPPITWDDVIAFGLALEATG